MAFDKEKNLSAAALRRRAEEELNALSAPEAPSRREDETQRLLHELQVHRIELEMQNEELRKSRDEIEALKERYIDLFDFAPVGYMTLDDKGTIRSTNFAGALLLGNERSRLNGQQFVQFVAEESRVAFDAFLEKVMAIPDKASCLITLVSGDGSGHAALVEGRVDTSGQECRIALLDITEQQRAQQERLKTEKLESLGILAGGIAHDFNNLLSAILGNISLALLQVNDQAKVTQRLQAAEQAVLRAKGLTRQLLTFARGGEPVRKVIKVKSLLQETVGFATLGTAVTCEMALAEDLCAVYADEDQLSQVILNLVVNAVQAMPDGGKIEIVAKNGISAPGGKGSVEISVKDSGSGIPEHLLQTIFEPYFTTKEQGSGLGLATSYSIIKKHGGDLTVESTPGEGATFYLTLPGTPLVTAAQPAVCGAVDSDKGRILVMDDEEMIREIIKMMLEELGYQVECTNNGNTAIELYQQRRAEGTPFAGVILDLTIPGGMGGKEVITALLQIDPEVKAIAASGYSSSPVMANCRDYGFSGVLAKPFGLREVSDVLRDLLVTDAGVE